MYQLGTVKLTDAIWLLQLVISSLLIHALCDKSPPRFEPRSPAMLISLYTDDYSLNVWLFSILIYPGFPLLWWHKFHVFSRLFPGKSNEISGNFRLESVFVLVM